MANLTPKLLYIGNATAANVYSVSSNTGSYSIVKNMNLCNAGANTVSCNIHILVSGVTTPYSNNAILKEFTIGPNETVSYNGIVVLPSNSKLYVSQTLPEVTFSISGVEYAT